MADIQLDPVSPLSGMALLTIGSVTVTEVDLGVLTVIAPFAGQGAACAKALQAAHGIAWPAPGRATGKAGARAIWFGMDAILLAGPQADHTLNAHAALTLQSDGWVSVSVEGADVRDVLARLVPIDLHPDSFKRGHTSRTLIQHMNGSVTRLGADRYVVMVFRSMAETLLHDLTRAMESIAARR
ncbi:MAG: sarcosine oxidase subunit gamma family protein [Pseudomonadota bacterium]